MIDVRGMRAEVPCYDTEGKPEVRVVMTAATDVARFVGRALEMGEWRGEEMRMGGERWRVRDLVALVQELRGKSVLPTLPCDAFVTPECVMLTLLFLILHREAVRSDPVPQSGFSPFRHPSHDRAAGRPGCDTFACAPGDGRRPLRLRSVSSERAVSRCEAGGI